MTALRTIIQDLVRLVHSTAVDSYEPLHAVQLVSVIDIGGATRPRAIAGTGPPAGRFGLETSDGRHQPFLGPGRTL